MTEFNRLIQQLPKAVKDKNLNQRTHQQKIYKYPMRLLVLGICILLGLSASQAWAQVSASGIPDYSALDYRSSEAAMVSILPAYDLEAVSTPIELAANITVSNEGEGNTGSFAGGGAASDRLNSNKATNKVEGTVDPVPPRFELGQQLYLETCATCHVGVPPAVLPNQTWIDLIQDTQHYGIQIPPIFDPGRLIIWQYLERFSRSLREEEQTPYRIRNSRFFRILHPRVEFSQPVRLSSCVSCHPGAPDFNYRRLTPEWQDSP